MLKAWRSAGLLWPALATALMCAFLLGLGTWQMQRKAWKEGLIAAIEVRSKQSPIAIDQAIERALEGGAAAIEYAQAEASGVFDHANERYYYAPDARLGPGYHVFTPLKIADSRYGSAIVVMVNRGFVPDTLKDPAKRVTGNVGGTVKVSGLVRVPARSGLLTPTNDAARNIWFWPDIPAMSGLPVVTSAAGAAGGTTPAVLPFWIDSAAEPGNPGGWPKGGTTNLTIPNRHLEYALTWYGLAATVVGVFIAFAINRLRTRPGT